MGRVVHFEIHAEKPERAVQFYTRVFGWEFTKWPGPEEYWLIQTGPKEEPGIDGGLIKRRGGVDGTAVVAYVCTINTANVDDAVGKVKANGGENVVPKMAVPTVGWLAYCKDTEGNVFGVMHPDPSAK
ncbi:MAG: hypothetical protein HW412_1702 [Bacteroidetes bacterium]|nr:hypothetical protein [Bacteroidota bacterium]